ncbi:unnamed protein product [Clavelina lepadiformis]|uniref:Connective tissue growth factor n=1 Tax=Clavelina lepadiformis TaxID=159417 RepID=A0ABP0FXD4_CLALP
MSTYNNVILFVTLVFISLTCVAGVPRAITTPSPKCLRKCSSCPKTPSCAPGVSLVLDDCGCCKTCARQIGESCNDKMKCDHHKNLYCSYSDIDENDGICVAKPGRSCFSGGQTYVNGESFNIGCKVTCTCIDGYLGCSPQCPITITATAPKNCLHPRLVTKPGKCCEEWACTSKRLNNTTTDESMRPIHSQRRVVSAPLRHRPRVIAAASRPQPIAITVREKDRCNVQTTEWSPCSKTCGWGISERVTTDNKACKLRKQTRLCQLRPCLAEFNNNIKKGKRCVRTVKAERRVRYSFSGCHSKVYTPKYCGTCTDGRCCTPKHTVTKPIKFTCDDGFQFKKRMMVIKSCQCSRKCASDNDIFFSYRSMGGDTWRE